MLAFGRPYQAKRVRFPSDTFSNLAMGIHPFCVRAGMIDVNPLTARTPRIHSGGVQRGAVDDSTNDKVDIGFNSDYNALHVFWAQENKITGEQHFDVARKTQLAKQLIALIATQYKNSKIQNEKNSA